MTELYSNQYLKIIQNDKNSQLYRIEFTDSNPILIHSLVKTKILRNTTYSDDYKLLVFKAYSVEMFKADATCSSPKVANMAATLGGQLKYMLDEYSHTFLGFNSENIIVVDYDRFAFLDVELIAKVEEESGMIMLYSPFNYGDFFVSPELKHFGSFPLKVHYKCAYFSLGCLLCYALLFGDDSFYQEYLRGEDNNIISILNTHSIRETKFYWFISRCLVEEAEKRSIVFI